MSQSTDQSREWRQTVVPTVLVALLMVTSIVVPFVSVTGVATAASSDGFTDSFESEPADAGVPDNWEAVTDPLNNGHSRNTTVEEVTADLAYAGGQSYYAEESETNNSVPLRPEGQPYTSHVTAHAAGALRLKSGTFDSNADRVAIDLYNSTGDHKPNVRVAVHNGSGSTKDGLIYRNATGVKKVLDSNVGTDEWVSVNITGIDLAGNTFNVTWESSSGASGSAGNLEMWRGMSKGWTTSLFSVEGGGYVDDADFGGETGNVKGQVVDQTGQPVSDATVQIWTVNSSQVADATEAKEKLKNHSDPIPDAWSSQSSSNFDIETHFDNAGARYALVTTKDTSDQPFIFDSADLSHPLVQVPANQPVMATVWEPECEGAWPCNGAAAGEYTRQQPGQIQTEGTVVFEQLDGSGSVTQTFSRSLNKTVGGGTLDPSQLHYAEVSLPAGTYRASAKSDENKTTAYYIQAGSPREALQSTLNATDGSPTNQSQSLQNELSNNTFSRITVDSDSNGEFSASVPSNVNVVGIQAYKASGLSVTSTNRTLSDIRSTANNGSLESAVYMPSKVYKAETPARGLTVTMQRVEYPDYGNLSTLQGELQNLLDKLKNQSQADLPMALQEELKNQSRAELEKLYTELDGLREQNQRLEELYKSQLQNGTTDESVNVDIDTGDATDAELRDRIDALQTSLTGLQETIDHTEPETDTGSETISMSTRFDDRGISSENVVARIHFSDGTSTVLSASNSSHLTTTTGVRGTSVALEDYPLGSGDAAVANVEFDVATEDGIAHVEQRVRNPTFEGEVPSLSSIGLSSLEPGPDEAVTVDLNPDDTTSFGSLQSVTVTGPSGARLSTFAENGTTARFRTNGSGYHTVEATYTNAGGTNFTEVFRIEAGSSSTDRPPSMRVVSGTSAGVYAIVGDGLSDGDVDVSGTGSKADINAVVPSDADAPRDLHVDANDLDLSTESTVSVNVLRGSDEQQVDKNVLVTLHAPAMSENGIVYRSANGDKNPLPKSEDGTYGRTTIKDNKTVVSVVSDNDGSVGVKMDADPNLVERALYGVRVNSPVGLPSLHLGIPIGSPELPDVPLLPAGGVPLIGLVAAAGLRHRSP